jgi:toxin-antitoxin system PIN domain toxin
VVEDTFSEESLVGLPWQTISAFIRILTNPNLPGERFSTREIVTIVYEWTEQPNVRFLSPGERHWSVLQQMLLEGQARGPMTTDAQLAALTIEHGGVLHTTDRDFSRFPGLRWVNPLIQA